jgi:DNA-binding transcriptional ArsR family regulator
MARSGGGKLNPSRAAPLFAALGDETRLRIVSRLCREGPLSLARLSEGASISRQAVTKHLDALSAAGIIVGEQSGRMCLWRLQTARLAEVRRYLDDISAHWDEAVERLRAFVENDDH